MTELDVFAICGQSNAQGRGDSGLSPDVETGTAKEYTSSGGLSTLDDPVGGAEDGSAWPAFARRWYDLRNVMAVYGQSATGATRMTQDGSNGSNGYWGVGGSLRSDAETFIEEMIQYIRDQGDTPNFRGILWWQGESDAQNIDEGSITQSDYESATREMIDQFRDNLGRPDLPFYIIEIGHQTSDGGTGDTAGYQDVRSSQRAIALSKSNVELVSDLSKTLIDQGYVSPTHGGTHHNQAAYDRIGTLAATTVYHRLFRETGQLARGTASALDSYTGEIAEVTVNSDTGRLRTHDGSTAGGTKLGKLSDL